MGAATYRLVELGAPPVSEIDARRHLRLHVDQDDDVLSLLIEVATQAAESYTRRSFRDGTTWELLLDEFCDRIEIRRDPVETIDSVTRLVDGTPTTVPASTYYLKRGPQAWEVLLQEDQEWPDDVDEREQAIVVRFTTGKHFREDAAREAILRATAHLYENRGDCDLPPGDLIRESGAAAILDQFRVSRV